MMFGVLVCYHPETEEEVVLKAFSGQYFGQWLVEGWVPPVLNVQDYQAQVQQDDGAIQSLTVQIQSLERALSQNKQMSCPAGEDSLL